MSDKKGMPFAANLIPNLSRLRAGLKLAPTPLPQTYRTLHPDAVLLRQLGQDLGHLVETGVQGLLFAYHLFKRHALDARTPDPDHDPVLSVGERLDRCRPEPAREYPVGGRRDPTALDVAHDREPGVVGAFGLVYVLVQFLGGEWRPLRDHDYEVALPLFVGLLEERQQRLGPRLELGDDRRLGPTGDGAHERQIARLAAHHLDHVRPLVGAGGVFDPVDSLQRRVERRVHPYRRLGTPHVVVYGRRNTGHLDPELGQPQTPGQAPVAADDHQPLDLGRGEPARRTPLPLGRRELSRAFRPQHRPPTVDDSPQAAPVHRVDPALQKPPVAGPDSHDLPAPEEGRPRHGPYRRVHPRRITPTGQDPDPQNWPPLALFSSHYEGTPSQALSPRSALISRKGVIKYERDGLRFRRCDFP